MCRDWTQYGGFVYYGRLMGDTPDARAVIWGSEEYPDIHGVVRFYQTWQGVFVAAEIYDLPLVPKHPKGTFFAFHIHEGSACTGDEQDPFAAVGAHYNPKETEHPYHAGDLPPLLSNGGYAVSAFLTNRFRLEEVLGRTVIIHGAADDFHTQPSGNAGAKLACGQIELCRRH